MRLHTTVTDASDFEPSTLAADFDDADLDIAAESNEATSEQHVAPDIDFAAAFGPVASRWEAMLRWYEMTTTPAVTH